MLKEYIITYFKIIVIYYKNNNRNSFIIGTYASCCNSLYLELSPLTHTTIFYYVIYEIKYKLNKCILMIAITDWSIL